MVHLMNLKKNELPKGWKLYKKYKDSTKYKHLDSFIVVQRDGKDYWFDWGTKNGGVISTCFVKGEHKNKVKPTLKRIMTKEFKMVRY